MPPKNRFDNGVEMPLNASSYSKTQSNVSGLDMVRRKKIGKRTADCDATTVAQGRGNATPLDAMWGVIPSVKVRLCFVNTLVCRDTAYSLIIRLNMSFSFFCRRTSNKHILYVIPIAVWDHRPDS